MAVLASVAVSGSAGSLTPVRETPIDPGQFAAVDLGPMGGTAMMMPTSTFDPANAARAGTQPGAPVVEPAYPMPTGAAPPAGVAQAPTPLVVVINPWHYDPEESWYGPGFYGQRTACGYALTTTLLGVANRTLPCGTLVTFRNPRNGRTITVPVVDRGPYVAGRQWDLTGATCLAIGHCYTGPLYWRLR